MRLNPETSIVEGAAWVPSPNFDDRAPGCSVDAIIIHSISLPPGGYGGGQIARFFQNDLAADEHAYFSGMAHLTVSSHFLIERSGKLVQFVATDKRAWHAGESFCLERPKVNDFSIGIELEGWDEDPSGYTSEQYKVLAKLTDCLRVRYPAIGPLSIYAHSDIAPGRKPDPGPYFDWSGYLNLIDISSM